MMQNVTLAYRQHDTRVTHWIVDEIYSLVILAAAVARM